MVLQDVSLLINDGKVPYARQMAFRHQVWHVVEIFTSHLRDRLEYTLDGSRDLVILLGGRGENPRYSQKSAQGYQVSQYFIDDHDIAAHFAVPEKDRQPLALQLMVAALSDIAGKIKRPTEPIQQAAAATLDCQFDAILPAPRIYPWEKKAPLAATKSGACTARLFRHVFAGTQEWGVQVFDAADHLLATKMIPAKVYQHAAAGQCFLKARCEGDVFSLINDKGKETFRWDLAKVVPKMKPATKTKPNSPQKKTK